MSSIKRKRIREYRSTGEFFLKTGLERADFDWFLSNQENLLNSIRIVDEYWLKGGDGAGTHFFFPLTRMRYVGEFFKGAFKAIAPVARVTLLVTPKHRDYGEKPAEAYLERHVSNSLRPGDGRFFIIDDIHSGDTVESIRRHLPGPTEYLDAALNLHLPEQMTYMAKEDDGKFAMGLGHVIDMERENSPAKMPHIEADIELNHGNEGRYFTEAEAAGIAGKRDIIEFIKSLPAKRQDEVIREMNRRDALALRKFFYYGVAMANDYVQTNGRVKIGINDMDWTATKYPGRFSGW